jgi:multidrug resistance efflux pump
MPETEKKESKSPSVGGRGTLIIWVIGVLILIGAAGAGLYYYVSSKTVYIDLSQVQAPLINLSPTNSGVLQAMYVNPGDMVTANEPVALVGNQVVEAQTAGEIVSTNNNIGQYMNTMTGAGTVATMIDPTQLRVVGNLDENKGLNNVVVGDPATFTVDAFGGQQFKGVVDEVAPTSEQGSVVFNISDQRPTNQFAVYVRFDPAQYPQLKNGMSARIWVYTQ